MIIHIYSYTNSLNMFKTVIMSEQNYWLSKYWFIRFFCLGRHFTVEKMVLYSTLRVASDRKLNLVGTLE